MGKNYRSQHTRKASQTVYDQIQADGSLSRRRWEIYDVLFRRGPLTANEVHRHTELHGTDGYRHNVQARMTELVDLGVVRAVDTVTCSQTGNVATQYDVTDALPDPERARRRRPKKPSRKKLRVVLEEMRELWKSGTTLSDETVELMRWIAAQVEPQQPEEQ